MLAPIDRPVVCPVIVGRERYLELLDGILAATAPQQYPGQGQTVLLAGEAGVGKTRMVSEVKERASGRGLLILQGNCFDTDRLLPYAPLLDMLRALLTTHRPEGGTALAPGWQTYAPELVKLLPELQAHIPGLAPTPPLDPEQEKRRLFDAICGFFDTLAASQPLLVIVEDLHWTDDTSLEFLLYMARRIARRPVLLLITYRSDEARPLSHFLAALDRERLSSEVRLDRLLINDVDLMMRAIFDLKRPLRGEFLDVIYSLTEGNAFFIEEVLKSLTASGDIFYADGAWERKPIQELHIPRSVQDAVQRRAEGLSEAGMRVLALAAVVGRRFDFTLLQALTGCDERTLLDVIKELMSAQLVVEESVDRFAFRHALTRQAVYSDLLVRERKSLHHTIAEAMEATYADTLDTYIADLAYHCFEAGMWQQALDYSRRAGENAQALYSPRAAIEQFTRAIDSAGKLGSDPPASLHRSRGLGHETLGEFEQARSDYEAALDLSRKAGETRGEWQALLDLGKLWAGRDYGRTGEYFRQALDLARTLDDRAALAHSLNRLGNWYANVDRPQEAVRFHQEALDIFEKSNDKAGIAETVDLLGMTTEISGDLVTGAAYYGRAIALFTEVNDKQGLCSSLAMRAICNGATYQTNTFVGARLPSIGGVSECLQALEIARDIGWRSGEASALWMLGFCLGTVGDYGPALGYAEAALSLATEIDHLQWMVASGNALGGILADIYALEKARPYLEWALNLAKEIGSIFWTRCAAGSLAACCVVQRDYSRAREVLDETMSTDFPWQTLGQRQCWLARAELALAQEDFHSALDVVDRLYSNAQNLGVEPHRTIPRLAMLRGEALLALGGLAEAEKWLLGALEGAAAFNSRSMMWRIHRLLGKLYAAQSRPEEAHHAFAEGRAMVEQLASTLSDEGLRSGYLQSAAAHFPAAALAQPAPIRRTAPPAPGGLTSRELEVALLVAQGKTNREIADELVLGERTIETHVGNALSKLGFSSRAQIAAWAVQNVIRRT